MSWKYTYLYKLNAQTVNLKFISTLKSKWINFLMIGGSEEGEGRVVHGGTSGLVAMILLY